MDPTIDDQKFRIWCYIWADAKMPMFKKNIFAFCNQLFCLKINTKKDAKTGNMDMKIMSQDYSCSNFIN